MPIKGVEQLDIERINSYEDNRFSEKVLRQHGAFVVNGIFFYEVLITGTSEAVITGENRKYYEAVIEYFRFFAEHITTFRDVQGNMVKEFPKVELFEIPLKNIQPSQFYVDKSKKKSGHFHPYEGRCHHSIEKVWKRNCFNGWTHEDGGCGRERVGYGAGFLVSGRGRLSGIFCDRSTKKKYLHTT